MVLNHVYSKAGKYTVKITHTDNKGLAQSATKIFEAVAVSGLVKLSTIFGPKKYNASSKTFTEFINISPTQVNDFYRLTIKNGDGLDHEPKSCKRLPFQELVKCLINNAKEAAYKIRYRARGVNLAINNETIVSANDFNQNTTKLITFVKLGQQNQLRLRVDGASSASVELVIEQFAKPVLDNEVPVLTANIKSNTLTNVNKFHISISDQSAVTTQIFKAGVLVATQQSKEFDVVLAEGVNSYIIKSVDAFNNRAPDFVLNSITLDSTVPKLAANVSSNSVTNINKIRINITDASSVTTQVFKNGSLLSTQQSKSFDLLLTEGANNFTLKSVDAAQNKAVDFIISNVVLDLSAPRLASSLGSNAVTNVNKVSFTVTDATSVTTQVFRNGVLLTTQQNKNFDVALIEGVNSFVLKAIDAAKNKAADYVISNVTLDTVAPILASNVVSNTTTANNKVRITITDTAAVTTQVYRNGTLIATQQVKSFDLPLVSGINNFILKATDAANNKARDFVLSNIKLEAADTSPPVLASSVRSNTLTASNTISVSITDQSAVSTDVFRNGVLIKTEQSKAFSLSLVEGVNNFVLKAVDSMQNRASDYLISNVTLDSIAPVLASNVQSNVLTNNNKIHITVTDASSVTTQVFKNGTFLEFKTAKAFDLTLSEGLNSFTLKSIDAVSNTSAILQISEVRLDTQKPVLATNILNHYVFDTLPQLVTANIQFNEPVTSVTLNNNPAIQIGPFEYSYTLKFDAPGVKNLVYKAIDLAGNEIIVQQAVNIVMDQAAPVITTNQIPVIISGNEFDVVVTITEASSVETQVFVDDQLQLTTSNKSFVYKVTFNSSQAIQSRKVNIVSKDSAQNISNYTFTITKDTSPLMVQIISPQNQSILDSPVVEIRAKANKPLAVAKVNGQIVTISPDQISIKAMLQQPSDGKFSVLVEVTDVSGAKASHQVNAEVLSNSLPSWTYEECRAE